MTPHILRRLARLDPVLGGVIRAAGPNRFRIEPECQPFETLAQAIAHQQLNGTAANTILGRLISSCGCGMFPTPQQVLAAPDTQLRAAGFSRAKTAALKDLAAKSLSGVVPKRRALEALGDEEIIALLTQVRGVGRWTVEMLLIFQLGRRDVLPVDDFGVRAGFRAAYGLRKLPRPPRRCACRGCAGGGLVPVAGAGARARRQAPRARRGGAYAAAAPAAACETN